MSDDNYSTPFSLAFLRGHHDVALAILEIVAAQYAPADQETTRYKLATGNSDDEDDEDESDVDSTDEPRIISEIVNKEFTIENIGQVSMQVKSTVKPVDFLVRRTLTFKVEGDKTRICKGVVQSPFTFVLENDDQAGLKSLLDMATHFAGRKLTGGVHGEEADEDTGGRFLFPEGDFLWAVKNGKTSALAEIISRTGAGIPLDDLVKGTGVKMTQKPRYYQGLSVYGKKR